MSKFVCICCGEEYHGDERIVCEICHMQVCSKCFKPENDMCYDCYHELIPRECEICKYLLDDEDFVSCDTCGHGVCHNCSPDDIHCKECYDEMEEDEDA